MGVERPTLIPHFIRHYASLGVDSFFIVLHSALPRSNNLRCAVDFLQSEGIEPKDYWYGTYFESQKRDRLARVAAAYVQQDDWVVNSDMDELIECDRFSKNPLLFRKLIQECGAHQYTYIAGRIVDMIAFDGSLPPMRQDISLWEQFPLACNLTSKVLRGCCHKIVASKGHHRVGSGAHNVSGFPKSRFPRCLRVNHFKWDDSAIPRLTERYASYSCAGLAHAEESRRFVHHVQAHGRIELGAVDFLGRISRFGGWAISPELFKFIILSVPIGSTILELGSGSGTQELSWFYNMCSVEHDPAWINRFDARYIAAPIVDGWYDVNILAAALKDLTYDLILVDGPPKAIGREGLIWNLHLFNTSGWILFDDVDRPGDRKNFEEVVRHLGGRRHGIFRGSEKDFGIIYPVARAHETERVPPHRAGQ